jgi:phospholipid transport system substrate-binding protein
MRTTFAVLGLFLAGALFIARPASAGAPMDQTKQTVDKVLSIVNDPNLKSPAKQQERREQLRQTIFPRFDFTEMARRSLGPHWARRSPQEQQEFVRVFTGLLENAYVEQIESANGDKVVYGREQMDGDTAIVPTKVITKKGEEVSITYKLRPVGAEWKVYDVVVEDISLVNNYRSQFNRVLANSSFDELMRRLQGKGGDDRSRRG